jgi:hypothetical protein
MVSLRHFRIEIKPDAEGLIPYIYPVGLENLKTEGILKKFQKVI